MRSLQWKAAAKINALLQLPYEDWMQDWDILLADSDRLSEFIQFYKENDLDSDEKFALMSLIIASYDDKISIDPSIEIEQNISSILHKDFAIHEDRIRYWCCFGSPITNTFNVTPFMRLIWNSQKKQ